MFKSYKPKGDRVKAVQVTAENAQEIAETFMGAVIEQKPTRLEGDFETDEPAKGDITGVKIPTLDGVKELALRWWIVKTEKNGIKFMSDDEFNQNYDPAYIVTRTTATV